MAMIIPSISSPATISYNASNLISGSELSHLRDGSGHPHQKSKGSTPVIPVGPVQGGAKYRDQVGAFSGAFPPREASSETITIMKRRSGWDGRKPCLPIGFMALASRRAKLGHFWGHFWGSGGVIMDNQQVLSLGPF